MTVTRRRRRRRDHVAARHGTGPKRGRLQVGGSISCWAWWRDTFWHRRWSFSLRPALSQTSESQVRVTVGPQATRSDPAWPADLAVAGRRPSYPSCIRVERVATRGAAGRGARQICATSPSRLVRRVTVAGLVTAKSAAAVTAGLPSAPGSVPPGRC